MSSRMKLFASLLIVLAAGVSLFLSSPPAHAADLDYTIKINGLKNRAEAVSYVDRQCAATNFLVAVAAYPYDVSFNPTNGSMSYSTDLYWKSCGRGNTRSLAITGYPADNSWGGQATCQVAGTYHMGPGVPTYDCIKYTWGDAGHFGGYARLGCGSGRFNYACVNGGGSPGGYFVSRVEVPELQPPTWAVNRTVTGLSGTVPNWNTVKQTSGTHPFDRPGAYCAWFKYNDDSSNPRGLWGVAGGGGCVDISIHITWTVANYELTPTITSVPDNSGLETPQARTVTGNVNNAGPTATRSNIDWRITQVVYAPNAAIPQRGGGTSANGTLPCTFFTGETSCSDTGVGVRGPGYAVGNTPESGVANIAEYDVGTRICFALSVRQYTHQTENWRHSALRCYIAGKKPKVNVLGGDLMVGRTVAGANTPAAARVLTSETQNSFGIFGSWSEYGIVPTGSIAGMRSGSGSVRGNTLNPNLLTFANSGNNVATCGTSLGCYGQTGSLPDIGSRFRTSTTTPVMTSRSLTSSATGVYRGSGNITISASTIAAGKWIVINAPGANVTIAGDIAYAQGPFSSAAQIPQVIIIANNITINDNVGNVDAWLVAPGTNNAGTVSGGVIRTCNVAPAAISVSACANKLTVNGPVIANRLLMLRTNGAEKGEASGDPAEVFNFRPDAYLWALQQGVTSGRVTTVSTKELPPRY